MRRQPKRARKCRPNLSFLRLSRICPQAVAGVRRRKARGKFSRLPEKLRGISANLRCMRFAPAGICIAHSAFPNEVVNAPCRDASGRVAFAGGNHLRQARVYFRNFLRRKFNVRSAQVFERVRAPRSLRNRDYPRFCAGTCARATCAQFGVRSASWGFPTFFPPAADAAGNAAPPARRFPEVYYVFIWQSSFRGFRFPLRVQTL